MVPGGVTEIIWHFAGYFHFIDDTVKDRFIYEDGAVRMRPDDYVHSVKESILRPDLPEFDTDKIKFRHDETPEDVKPADPLPPRFLPIGKFRETDTDTDDPGRVPMQKLHPAAASVGGLVLFRHGLADCIRERG